MQEKKLFGIMAHPVHHSLSPIMHNAAFAQLGLPYHYHAFDIHPSQLEKAFEAMKLFKISGVNVSIPHKESVIHFLDEIDEEARVIGAVNTIILQENGCLKGYNTDGAGYVQSLLAETRIQLKEYKTLLLGAGGAAKGIAVYLLKNGCRDLVITNRTEHKANELMDQLQHYCQGRKLQATIRTMAWEQASTHIGEVGLLINTTPIGMWPHTDDTPLQIGQLAPKTIVSDIVYNPLKTRFLQLAEEKGGIIHQGLGMFIHQGALAFEYFTGQQAPVQFMKETVLQHLQQGG